MAKRDSEKSDDLQRKRTKLVEPAAVMNPLPRVCLNEFDCDRDFVINMNCLQGSSYCEDGVDYFCGARANLGLVGGKYCFSAKVVSSTRADQSHSCVIGISRGDCALGELNETMKFTASGKFKGYGKKCNVGQTFVCAVDMEKYPRIKIDFFVNRKKIHVGKNLEVEEIKNRESALFPHVLLKNVAVQFKFSTDDGLVPRKGYEPWAAAILKEDKLYWGPASRNISSEKPLPLCSSSSMQHFKRAPSLTASGLSLENRAGVGDHGLGPYSSHPLVGGPRESYYPSYESANNFGTTPYNPSAMRIQTYQSASPFPQGVGDHCLGQYSSPPQVGTPYEDYYANPHSFESRNTSGFTGSFSDHHLGQINDLPSRAESSTSYRVVADRSRSNVAESRHILYGTSCPSQRNADNLYPLTSALSGVTPYNPPAMRTHMYRSDSLFPQGVGDHCLGQYSSPSQAGTPNENYYANPPSFESRNTLGFTGSFSDHHSTQINDPPSRAESSTSYRVVSDRSRSNVAESGHIFYGTSGPSQRNTDNLYPLTSTLSGATRDNPPAMRTDMYQSDSPFPQGFHGTPSSTTPPSVKSPSDVPREERTSSH